MAQRKILIIDAHPDRDPDRFVHALAAAYAKGATAHTVKTLRLADIQFPMMRSPTEWTLAAPPSIIEAQELVKWAEHIVILFPLWLGDMPALLKAFCEQTFRPEFAFRYRTRAMPEKLLTGRSARIIVTMAMPGFFYELFYRAHSVKSLERNILKFAGIAPIRHTIVGSVEAGDKQRQDWLRKIEALGRAAA